MNTTLTIRLPREQREALRKRAAALNKSESDLVRALISRDLSEATLLERAARLVGSVDSRTKNTPPNPLAKRIRDRNWRK
jgi:predicted DNA-binding protein